MLNVQWWRVQQEIVEALLKYRRVFVKAGHSVGKSHLAGSLVNWFYDAYPQGITITTAPTKESVIDIVWKEVRLQRPAHLRHILLPKAPRMQDADDHFAVGYTANGEAAFHGRHERAVFLIYDECVGIDAPYWTAGEGMMSSEVAYWIAFCNPTDTASAAYDQCVNSGSWHTIEISCLDHPNIAAELAGKPRPFPKAVSLEWVEGRIKEWCQPIPVEDKRAGDFEFPPGSGFWHRPGPLGECRLLGRWPSTGATSVWTEALWQAAMTPQEFDESAPLQIGCDVARFGDDFTSLIVRRGSCALHHETHNGWDTAQTAGRLKQLAKQFSLPCENPAQVLVAIDDDGVGGGVFDQRGEFAGFCPARAAERAISPDDYPNRRSEFWFVTAGRADEGLLDLSRLPDATLRQLRRQVMSPTWKVDSQGRRVVEPKDDTKKRIGRSPDDADALNLAYASVRRIGRGA